MDTEKNKKENNIKSAPYVCVLKCVHNREIEKTGIDQVLSLWPKMTFDRRHALHKFSK